MAGNIPTKSDFGMGGRRGLSDKGPLVCGRFELTALAQWFSPLLRAARLTTELVPDDLTEARSTWRLKRLVQR